MAKFYVTIEEVISQEFEVEANNEEEAEEIMTRKYRDNMIKLDNPCVIETNVMVSDENRNECGDWHRMGY